MLILEALDKASGVINNAVSKATTKLEGFSQKSAAFGRRAIMGAAVIGAPLVMAVNDSLDFEDKLGNIATIIDTNTESLSAMGDGILSLSKRMPVATDDLTNSLYDIRSAGIEAGVAFDTLEDSAKLSVSGLSTVSEATDIMTSAMNAFKTEGLSSAQIADILFKTTAYGKTTIAQLSQAFGANASIINAAGVKLADFSAATAAMTTGGVPAAQAQNQLRAAVVSLIKPGHDMEKIFKRIGVATGDELFQKFGTLGGAFDAVKSTADDMHINLAKATGSVEALGAMLSITGATNDVYTKSLADMTTGSNAIDLAFEKQADKGKNRMATMRNNVKALSISIGNVLMPTVLELIKVFSDVAESMSAFAAEHPLLTKVIVIATGATAAFLAILGTLSLVASAVSGGLAALGTIYTFLTTRVSLATVAQWLMNAAEWAAIAVGSVLVVSVLALATAYDWVKGGIVKAVTAIRSWTIWQKIVTAGQWLWNAAMAANPIGLIVAAVVALIAAVAALVYYWEDLVQWFKDAPLPIKILVGIFAILNLPIILLAFIIRKVIDNWKGMVQAFSNGWAKVVGFFTKLKNGAVNTFNKIVDFVKSIPSKMFEAGKNIVNSIWEGMKSVAMAPINFISDLTSGIRDFLPFSPAKRGALRDIHRIKLVETIAASIKPGPAVKAMDKVTTAMAVVAPKATPLASNSFSSSRSSVSTAFGGVTLNFSPSITVNGGGNGASMGAEIVEELRKLKPEISRMLKSILEDQKRTKF